MPYVSDAPAGWLQTPVRKRWVASRAHEYAVQIVYAACYLCVILGRKGERRGSGIGVFLDAMVAFCYVFLAFLVRGIFSASRESQRAQNYW